ncbi:protein FAR1-RELATED SEQUENCE 9-like [Henckelia pumila]|uniref:protein FAR1-RELATED SEQUENCE 9-like n=1 Tax=Henckelia pumila TaxID=405737 RepID=UPI003C6E9015
MDIIEDEAVRNREELMDLRMSNSLDLNLEHDCRNFNSNTNGVSSAGYSKDKVLKLGMEFVSDEQGYGFYSRYAELVGFIVRKDWVNRSKVHGRVMSRKFTCSRQGHRKKDKRDINVKKHRKETRTGCLAYMVVTRQPNGKYQVTQFEEEHNHDDVDLSKADKLMEFPLCENWESTEVPESDSMKNLETKSKSTLSIQLLGIRLCAPEKFDDLQSETENLYLNTERTRVMKEGDAAQLLYYFQRQHFINPAFFYLVQLDVEDKITNIFWADDNMIIDYGLFGDVVCLDTSSIRNKDSRPFVLFVGLNHHRQVVVFGAALLYDDTVDTFKWLFQTFVETMSGKKPKFILSDQDATIVQAIHALLPETNHFICAWQMYLIALKHLRHLISDHDSFATDFRNCILSHEQEDEFIQAWDSMLEKHGLHQNSWLKWMFREKEKWAATYGRNTFFIESNAKHLVEQMSDKFRSYLSPDLDVLQFLKHFESMVNELKYSEIEAAFQTQRQAPVLMANAVLLKHPSDIYTPKAFEVFQREYEKCLNIIINKSGEQDSKFDYKVRTYGKSKDFSVVYNSLDGTVSCNCLKFEHVGFLCSHALKVLDHHNIKVVPSCYILKRWTNDARMLPVREDYSYSEEDNRKMIATRYKDLCRNIIKISARAAESDPAFEFAARQLDEVMQGVERIFNFKSFENIRGTFASENAPAVVGLDRNDFGHQVANVLQETVETESMVPDTDQLNHYDEQVPSASGGLDVRSSPSRAVLSVASAPSAYISSPIPAPTLSSITQGLYSIEANHGVQRMYQTSNLAISHQPNPNMYEPQAFYSNQHSPTHSHILQESLICNQFQDSMSNGTQLKQVVDDGQLTHSSSFMHYSRRYRAADV